MLIWIPGNFFHSTSVPWYKISSNTRPPQVLANHAITWFLSNSCINGLKYVQWCHHALPLGGLRGIGWQKSGFLPFSQTTFIICQISCLMIDRGYHLSMIMYSKTILTQGFWGLRSQRINWGLYICR